MYLCTFAIKKILKWLKIAIQSNLIIDDLSGSYLIPIYAYIILSLNMTHKIVKKKTSPKDRQTQNLYQHFKLAQFKNYYASASHPKVKFVYN